MQHDDKVEFTWRPNSIKSIIATSKYNVSEMANKMNRHTVDIFLNVALQNVKRVRMPRDNPIKRIE